MSEICFEARLVAPMEGKGWTYATLPPTASRKLGARGRVPVEVEVGGARFRTSVFPDGNGGHSFMVNAEMRKAAGAHVGDKARFALRVVSDTVAVEVPPDVKAALAGAGKARAQFEAVTDKARAEWVAWATSAKKAETRARRIASMLERLAAGARRPSE